MDAGGTIPGRWQSLTMNVGVWQKIGENQSYIWLILILIVFSAYFSATETALTAMNRVRLRARENAGDRRAARAMRFSDRYESTLSTLLVGNNLVNIAMGSIATLLALKIGVAESLMTVVITIVVVLFGEVLPKRLAKRFADRFIVAVSPLLRAIAWVLTPVSAVFGALSRFAAKLFAKPQGPTVSEDDIYDMIETMDDSGSAGTEECRLLYSAFEFSDVTAGDIYTERGDVVWIDTKMAPDEIVRVIQDNKYSRLPVCTGTLDCVQGILRVRPYLEQILDGKKPVLSTLMTKAYFTTPEQKAGTLLEEMQQHRVHMAIVRDETGATLGIVTIEDLIEELVGEIWDESDEVSDEFHPVNESTFEMDARLSVPAALELMEYDDFDREECGHRTLEKWILRCADGMPVVKGSVINYRRLNIEILSMHYGRIGQIRITVLPEESGVEEE